MIGVFAQANIRDDHHFGHRVFDGADRLLHDAIRGKVFLSDRIFRSRDSKQHNRRDPQIGYLFSFLGKLIDRPLVDAWHRDDFLANAVAMTDEQRIDKIPGIELGLAHHGPQGGGQPQASWTHRLRSG